jgi:hypothetical protein
LDSQNKSIKLKEQKTNLEKEILELDKLIKTKKEILIEE